MAIYKEAPPVRPVVEDDEAEDAPSPAPVWQARLAFWLLVSAAPLVYLGLPGGFYDRMEMAWASAAAQGVALVVALRAGVLVWSRLPALGAAPFVAGGLVGAAATAAALMSGLWRRLIEDLFGWDGLGVGEALMGEGALAAMGLTPADAAVVLGMVVLWVVASFRLARS